MMEFRIMVNWTVLKLDMGSTAYEKHAFYNYVELLRTHTIRLRSEEEHRQVSDGDRGMAHMGFHA